MTSLLFLSLLGQIDVRNDGGYVGRTRGVIDCRGGLNCSVDAGVAYISAAGLGGTGGGSGAPTGAKYITQTADDTLSAEQAMGSLTTGLVLNATTTGVQSIYTGTSCTNQFPRSLSASGAATCASVVAADISGAVATASALAADGTNCAGNNFALGVDTAGAAQCAQPAFSNLSGAATDSQVPNDITVTLAATATALASNPTDCGGGQYATAIDASGNLTCSTPPSGSGGQTARLTSDHAISSTTATEVAGLQVSLAGAGTYLAEYWLISQSATTTVGLKYGVNFTGSLTLLKCNRLYPSTGAAAATGVADDVAAVLTGSLYEANSTNTASTTAPNLGPTTGVAAINSNTLERIECVIVAGGAGDLEVWHGSETATSTTIKAQSLARVTAIP